jgi:hypothetical protein
MATVNKDFKIKSGLIVEGTTATVNGFDVLTKKTADQNYIIDLIGGTATSANTANTVVKRDASGDFAAGDITADLIGNVTGTVSDISNHDTDDLGEGTINQYFTNQRALDATAAAYDTSGAAATVASDLTDHENATVAHGAQGAVVGTTNTQTLTNKTIGDTLNFTGAGAMTINSDSHIVLTPAAGSSVKWGADVLATQAYADQAEADAKAYADAEIAALVDSAPELLDTLNELAAAIGDNPNYATDLATSVGTKVSKAGDTMTGLLVLSADPSANLGAATKQYVDAAQGAAEDYADGLINDASNASDEVWSAYKTATEIGLAQQAAIDAANDLTTDDVAEGSAQYFTDALAKSSAADLLTGAILSNITITGTGSGLTITAEDGIAGKTTTDLAEGTNKYFTDVRAVDALEAVVPNFTAVEVNSLAKEVAVTATVSTPSTATALTWDTAVHRTVKALVKFATPSHTEVSEVLLTLDGLDNIAITEYAMVGTNGSMGTITATVVAGEGRLNVTTLNNATVVFVKATLLV